MPRLWLELRSVIPTARALVSLHQSLRYTWREFDDAVTRVALGLAGLALRRQDRVGNWSANCAEWILLQYAYARAMLEAIQKEKTTVVTGVPTMFIAQLPHPDFPQFDVSSLRAALIGAHRVRWNFCGG